jgi:hypothetical protein
VVLDAEGAMLEAEVEAVVDECRREREADLRTLWNDDLGESVGDGEARTSAILREMDCSDRKHLTNSIFCPCKKRRAKF